MKQCSEAALELAEKNMRTLGLQDRVRTFQGSWLEPIESESFDCIVSNPPYIAPDDPNRSPETDFEPSQALFAEDEGLADVKHIMKSSMNCLREKGKIFIECGSGQDGAMKEYLSEIGDVYEAIDYHHDLAGKFRVLELSQS